MVWWRATGVVLELLLELSGRPLAAIGAGINRLGDDPAVVQRQMSATGALRSSGGAFDDHS
jgi:hypothetical protein